MKDESMSKIMSSVVKSSDVGVSKQQRGDGRNRETKQNKLIKDRPDRRAKGEAAAEDDHKLSREKRKRASEHEQRSKYEAELKRSRGNVDRDEKRGRFDRWELNSDDRRVKKPLKSEPLRAEPRTSVRKSHRRQSSPPHERATKHRGSSPPASPESPKRGKRRSSHGSKELERSPAVHWADRFRTENPEKEWDQQKIDRERGQDRSTNAASRGTRHGRFHGRGNRLGGYSPRRRRSEEGDNSPSPRPKSPEKRSKKSRAWDLPPSRMDSNMIAAMAAAHHVAAQQAAAIATATGLVGGPGSAAFSAQISLVSAIPASGSSALQHSGPAVTDFSLTQATRISRSLYIENVPSSVSEGELLEFMNAVMLSSNANHLPGTKPCINCRVQVDKSYALTEFLTPEDATAAIAFDGIALHGTILKIRRPKDFVHSIDGGLEFSSSAAVDMVSNLVIDSPRKVFVGGISSSLSSEKVKEILTAFGQLKAYHWEFDKSRNPPEGFAFLEYLDPSVTLKACAGLNGMRLGNSILTAVQATPNAFSEEAAGEVPFYGVPEHAKTLLAAPTCILEIQNAVAEEELATLQQEALDEIMEDVLIECSRFGKVKSLYLLNPASGEKSIAFSWKEPIKAPYVRELLSKSLESGHTIENSTLQTAASSLKPVGVLLPSPLKRSLYASSYLHQPLYSSKISEQELGISPLQTLAETTSSLVVPSGLSSAKSSPCPSPKGNHADMVLVATSENANQHADSNAHLTNTSEQKIVELNIPTNMVTHPFGGMASSNKTVISSVEEVDRNTPTRTVKQENLSEDSEPLCPGRIYVEFSRKESACQAAHALHGRAYGEKQVFISYFPLDIYNRKTWKKAAS